MGSPFKTVIGGVSPFLQNEEGVVDIPRRVDIPVTESGIRGKTEFRQGPDINERIVNAVSKLIAPQNLEEAIFGIGSLGLNKIPGINRLISKIFSGKGTKMVTKGGAGTKTGFDFAKHNVKVDANIARYGSGNPTIYPTPKTWAEIEKITTHATKGIGAQGAKLDKLGITTKDLSVKNVKNLGTSKSGQTIYEVTYPNGQKMKFWESTGSGGKAVELSKRNAHLNAPNSKGYFGVLPGHVDRSLLPRKGSKSWFIKSEGWERGYGSAIIEDTGIWLQSLKKAGKI